MLVRRTALSAAVLACALSGCATSPARQAAQPTRPRTAAPTPSAPSPQAATDALFKVLEAAFAPFAYRTDMPVIANQVAPLVKCPNSGTASGSIAIIFLGTPGRPDPKNEGAIVLGYFAQHGWTVTGWTPGSDLDPKDSTTQHATSTKDGATIVVNEGSGKNIDKHGLVVDASTACLPGPAPATDRPLS